ncbi:hypothetical protein EJ06DRAFT_528771 [Trichodelitschia bisporula]|uniref:Uncharacterized protein n=1 Tax=Trichodelitschia bisporula TaxID=703511 RepID=A0A6G1I003_9PEZI|nr:hypothetical protein EJ06DRAFT_528771 [Trichodelitschia bisporula]
MQTFSNDRAPLAALSLYIASPRSHTSHSPAADVPLPRQAPQSGLSTPSCRTAVFVRGRSSQLSGVFWTSFTMSSRLRSRA